MSINIRLEIYYLTDGIDCLCFNCAVKEANKGKQVTTKADEYSESYTRSCDDCGSYFF